MPVLSFFVINCSFFSTRTCAHITASNLRSSDLRWSCFCDMFSTLARAVYGNQLVCKFFDYNDLAMMYAVFDINPSNGRVRWWSIGLLISGGGKSASAETFPSWQRDPVILERQAIGGKRQVCSPNREMGRTRFKCDEIRRKWEANWTRTVDSSSR